MAHFLYRPHTRHGEKVVTTDFLIRQCDIFPDSSGSASIPLPVDLLNCAIDLDGGQDRALVAPAIFAFAGDKDEYMAPAFALLDGDAYASNQRTAWSLARVSVSRLAVPAGSRDEIAFSTDGENGGNCPTTLVQHAMRYRAAIILLAEPRHYPLSSRHHLRIGSDPSAEHHLSVNSIAREAQR